MELTKEEITKILEHLYYEDKMCSVCKYEDDCFKDIRCYCGEPIYPPCYDYDEDFINIVDFEKLEEFR